MKKIILLLIISIILFSGCRNTYIINSSNSDNNSSITTNTNKINEKDTASKPNYINPDGMEISTRFNLPQGFTRTKGTDYENFIRSFKLLPNKSPVLLYDGSKKSNQNSHLAVLNLDVGEKNLQQCADSIIRLRCEFLFETEQFDAITYHLTNGDEFPYIKYRDGYRLKVEGNKTWLEKTASYDDSYETFRKYLDILFCYAGTYSLDKESKSIGKSDMQIGDIFIKGGSPGHCVMVMDMCENADGEKMFLLGQGYMPAQQMHILKKPNSDCPWYSLDELEYPLETPEYIFYNECLKRIP